MGRLRACARTIGWKVITSAAPALAFLLYFCVTYNKQLNNLNRSLRENLKPRRNIVTSLPFGQYGEAKVWDFPVMTSILVIK